MEVRVGFGYDVHPLVPGRKLFLGGVEIEWHQGLQGHSDADVLIHAICDALLGAAGKGDLGRHFPDSDPRYKDVPSSELLKEVKDMVEREGFQVGNIDATIVAQRPKLSPYIPKMERTVASILGVEPSRVNIKATTTEHLGFTGREEGMAAYAVTILLREELS